ncbi:kinase-like protein [Conidiobolus coronatus NRRL 28638]|uniref:Aurora kinase n=1 Tax=Conidiobolus coronatus (strain ATCC 28846 / CBS 209.66 / NRRL 28638) TaxID=796925 RepID=A0A137P467_CONC2|nr:kinase-like protein [Conidiobolus coronatus NRRL 28638]|eukprot:KXN69818.1 kinase-like protein [Conidiobolus coronatus NRRL 28638]
MKFSKGNSTESNTNKPLMNILSSTKFKLSKSTRNNNNNRTGQRNVRLINSGGNSLEPLTPIDSVGQFRESGNNLKTNVLDKDDEVEDNNNGSLTLTNSTKNSIISIDINSKLKLKSLHSATSTTIDNFEKPYPLSSSAYRSSLTSLPKTINNDPINGQRWKSEDFLKKKRLGSGQFGTVYLATEIRSNRDVALKIISKTKILRCGGLSQLKREVEITCHLKHPHIARLYGYFQNETHVFLVMEYAPMGDLYSHFKKVLKFDERTTSTYIYQLALALQYIQRKDVIHRDIKPENIVMFPNNIIKLTDFGWSVHSPTLRRVTMCGTLDYMAPEIVESSEYDHTLDLWGLGVLCYELITGNPPFEHISKKSTQTRIINVDLKFSRGISEGARDLIQKLLKYDPKERITIREVLDHPWILKYNNV